MSGAELSRHPKAEDIRSTGIGYWTVLHLARKGAKVYLAARNEGKALEAIKNMTEAGIGSGQVVWLPFDLKDPRLAKKAAEDFLSREKRLDVLSESCTLQPALN